jgi:hypothetical protein
MAAELQRVLLQHIAQETNQPVAGVEPSVLMNYFPSLQVRDFDGVEAVVGQYLVVGTELQYNNTDVADSAADDVAEAGFKTLFTNYYARVSLPVQTPLRDVVASLKTATSTAPVAKDDFVACTMDAMQCPGGSYVGRTGPDCTFTCPSAVDPVSPNEIVCTKEQKEADVCIEIYAPVCAQVQVECVTTPCDSVPQTFPNGCFACASDRVISYTEGMCSGGGELIVQ